MLTISAPDGTAGSCRILDAAGTDAGLASSATAIRIDLRAGEIGAATIDLGLFRTETAVGKVEWLARNPRAGGMTALASMTFQDGTRVTFPDDATAPVVDAMLKPPPGCEPMAECVVTLTQYGYSASGPADAQGMACGINAGADLDAALDFVRERFAALPAPDLAGIPPVEAE